MTTSIMTLPSELVDTEERVQEALHRLHVGSSSVLTLTSQPTDTAEVTVSTFMSTGCGCHRVKGAPCYQQFLLSYMEEFRASYAELTTVELDMVMMGQLAAGMDTSHVVSTIVHHNNDDGDTSFSHQGKPVCVKIFHFLHGIGKKRLKNLMKRLKWNGLHPRVHNMNKRSKHPLSFSLTKNVVLFSSAMPSSTPYSFLGEF